MDASAVLEYFAPLQTWLKEQNKGKTCGWKPAGTAVAAAPAPPSRPDDSLRTSRPAGFCACGQPRFAESLRRSALAFREPAMPPGPHAPTSNRLPPLLAGARPVPQAQSCRDSRDASVGAPRPTGRTAQPSCSREAAVPGRPCRTAIRRRRPQGGRSTAQPSACEAHARHGALQAGRPLPLLGQRRLPRHAATPAHAGAVGHGAILPHGDLAPQPCTATPCPRATTSTRRWRATAGDLRARGSWSPRLALATSATTSSPTSPACRWSWCAAPTAHDARLPQRLPASRRPDRAVRRTRREGAALPLPRLDLRRSTAAAQRRRR